jgi:hypothetical protein
VLRQMARVLHFTGRDESVRAIIEGLLGISEVIPLRHLDAGDLLAACEAQIGKVLYPLWAQVEEALCQSWADANADAPEYCAAIAKVMHDLQSARFGALLKPMVMAEPVSEPQWAVALQALATWAGRVWWRPCKPWPGNPRQATSQAGILYTPSCPWLTLCSQRMKRRCWKR